MNIKNLVIPMSRYEEFEKKGKLRLTYLKKWEELNLSDQSSIMIFLVKNFKPGDVKFTNSEDGDLIIQATHKESKSRYYFQIPEIEIKEDNPWCVVSIINKWSALNFGQKYFNDIIWDWNNYDVLKSIKADVEVIRK